MKEKLYKKGLFLIEATLASYSQIFFTENRLLGIILILASFINWWVGLSGLLAVLVTIALSEILKYSTITTHKGLFGFNSLLVGLGIGTYFSAGLEVVLLIIIGSAIAFFSTIFLMGLLAKYGLPFLSIPFLLAMWLMILAFPAFQGISLNTDALYPANSLFKLGGNIIVLINEGLSNFFEGTGFDTYFLSIGAIFFQFNILAGFLIAIGLLIHSRINFAFSIIGFFTAYWFYSFLGLYQGSLNYTYYGFNFILSAIAIGGYFVIPSRQSFLWSLFLIPVLVVTTIGLDRLFAVFELSVFSLPFNIVVISTIYAFKIRYDQTKAPILIIAQQDNPEKNAYLYHSKTAKQHTAYVYPIRLPFIGKWSVNQGHSGEFTHKDFYRFAWDFIIKDETTDKEFSGDGYFVDDYYCYNKPVLAPAAGTIVAVENTIEDNEIGITNNLKNWGNTIVIKHQEYLYSKLSHLKKESVNVKIGDIVQEGQIIGKCGNSGRSPYPHLHFQLQATPEIEASTIFWPISEYVIEQDEKTEFIEKGIPNKHDSISNIATSNILKSAFEWNPGDEFKLSYLHDDQIKNPYHIRNEIDIFNHSFLKCSKTGAKLYYYNNGKTYSSLNYIGSKKSPLYNLFRATYKVVFSEKDSLSLESNFPAHLLYKFPVITIQDFVLPFWMYLKGKFQLTIHDPEQLLNPDKIRLKSQVSGRNQIHFTSEIEVHKSREIVFIINTPTKEQVQLKWERSS